jgi:hypothetical protein
MMAAKKSSSKVISPEAAAGFWIKDNFPDQTTEEQEAVLAAMFELFYKHAYEKAMRRAAETAEKSETAAGMKARIKALHEEAEEDFERFVSKED